MERQESVLVKTTCPSCGHVHDVEVNPAALMGKGASEKKKAAVRKNGTRGGRRRTRPRVFKDPDLQKTYESLVGADQLVVDRTLVEQGSMQIAFTRGYHRLPLEGVHDYGRNSHAYAAYCAGKDRKERELKKQ